MKNADAAKEIMEHLEEAVRRGALPPSDALREFLNELAQSPGLKKPVKQTKTPQAGDSAKAKKRIASGPTEADMSLKIDELAKKLRSAFDSDDLFENILADPHLQKLSKSNVVTLYNRVFESPRPLAKSITKPELFNAIRRERIMAVRARS